MLWPFLMNIRVMKMNKQENSGAGYSIRLKIARFIYLIFFVSLFAGCSIKPEEWLEKATTALKNENSEEALYYYQKAYEASLDDSFIVLDRESVFDRLQLSSDGEWLVAVRDRSIGQMFVEEPEDGSSSMLLYEIKTEDEHHATVPDSIHYMHVSPHARFVLLMFKQENDNCSIMAYSREQEKSLKSDILLDCNQSIAIDEKGGAYYMKDQKIGYYDFVNGLDTYPYLKRFPDKPISQFPAYPAIAVSADNTPFLTYGAAGRYKLYNLANKKLKLLARNVSSPRIYFTRDIQGVGVVIGGAGSYRLAYFHPTEYGKELKKYPVRRWQDVAFNTKDHYYYLQNNSYFEKKPDQKNEVELPFSITDAGVGSDSALYMLSETGIILAYRNTMPRPESLRLYKLAVEIDQKK